MIAPEPFEAFKSFKPLFEGQPGTTPRYLTLLNAVREDAAFAIAEIRAARQRSGDNLEAELRAMLLYDNWRPQIVGAVALLLGATPSQTRLLWEAIEKPSWISPQLAATAYQVDPNFCAEALLRIERRARLNIDEASTMDWLQRHSALGPRSFDAHSAKLLAALVALVKRGDQGSDLLSAIDIQEIIASDTDGGGDIAVGWLEDIRLMLEHPIAKNFKPDA